MATIKIKPAHPSQGDCVIIEEGDFNPDIHELLDEPKAEDKRSPGRPRKGNQE
jgi:hypothetical protein